MFYMIGAFDFDQAHYPAGAAERHYLEYHVPLARRLPGLRTYVIGKVAATARIPAERQRAAVLAFDNFDALRAAYDSPVGRELREDERRLIVEPRVILLDGQEVL